MQENLVLGDFKNHTYSPRSQERAVKRAIKDFTSAKCGEDYAKSRAILKSYNQLTKDVKRDYNVLTPHEKLLFAGKVLTPAIKNGRACTFEDAIEVFKTIFTAEEKRNGSTIQPVSSAELEKVKEASIVNANTNTEAKAKTYQETFEA